MDGVVIETLVHHMLYTPSCFTGPDLMHISRIVNAMNDAGFVCRLDARIERDYFEAKFWAPSDRVSSEYRTAMDLAASGLPGSFIREVLEGRKNPTVVVSNRRREAVVATKAKEG